MTGSAFSFQVLTVGFPLSVFLIVCLLGYLHRQPRR